MIKKYIINKAGKRLIKRFSKKHMSAAQKRALSKAVKASAAARRKTVVKSISKRKIKKLASLKTRIKANQQALKLVSGTNTVFRLQNKKGQGPLIKRVVPPKRIASMLDSARKPFPVQRHQNIKALQKSIPNAHFEYLDFKRGESFGFKNIKQAERWFNKQELDWYKKRGYNLTKVSGVTINSTSKTQLTFTKAKNLNKLLKEKERLATKYKKLGR